MIGERKRDRITKRAAAYRIVYGRASGAAGKLPGDVSARRKKKIPAAPQGKRKGRGYAPRLALFHPCPNVADFLVSGIHFRAKVPTRPSRIYGVIRIAGRRWGIFAAVVFFCCKPFRLFPADPFGAFWELRFHFRAICPMQRIYISKVPANNKIFFHGFPLSALVSSGAGSIIFAFWLPQG